MSKAQTELLQRLAVLEKCSLVHAVTEGLPHEIERNELGTLFRNGLSVMAFAIAEAFLRDRVGEILTKFNAKNIKLSDFSDSLQELVTLEALRGLSFRAKHQDKSTKINWLLSHVADIAKATKNVSSLSRFSFGNSSSNVGVDDISKVLGAFGISSAWDAIDGISKNIGCGGPVTQRELFVSLSKRRHAAAHDVTAYVSHLDLLNARKNILGTCVGFDLLLSHALSLHNLGTPPHKTGLKVVGVNIKFRRISHHSISGYKEEYQSIAGGKTNWRTYKRYPTIKLAKSFAKKNAKLLKGHVVVLDSKGFPEFWESWAA